jgi:hypothetical protein
MQNNRSAFADAGAHFHTKVQALNSPEKEYRVHTPISKSKVAAKPQSAALLPFSFAL